MTIKRATTPVPPQLRSSFDQLRRQLQTTATLTEVPNEKSAEVLRFELALRGRCDPRGLVAKHLAGTDPSSVLDAVAADCETGTSRDRRWLLRESVRRRVLQAKPKDAIAAALRDMPTAESDDVSLALRRLYVEPLSTLDPLSAQDLRLLLAAVEWAGEHAPYKYDGREVRRLLAARTRVEEYERLVSRGVFGRGKEIARLVDFLSVPVQRPGAMPVRYLHAFGPGGIGKSTLIASAALLVLRTSVEPVLVHLDFDRADLDPVRAWTLSLELLRQAGLAGRDLDRMLDDLRDRLREQVADEVSTDDGVLRQMAQQEANAATSISALVNALAPLTQTVRPLLIIVDTFEQVEAGGVQYVAAMQRWLDEVASLAGAPEVRVLVSGRTPPKEGAFANAPDADLMEIEELDLPGALELLGSHRISPEVGTQIHETFGGNPLVLRIAAEMIVRLGPEAIGKIVADAREGRLPREMVQGLLYDRFLNHIQEPANEYAHPGLVLPEITVDLIREVLGPAQGHLPSDVPAQAIYDALKGATWLVKEVDGRALEQRRDFRQLLLKLMNSDPARSASVQQVREQAIKYHSRSSEPSDRAFVLYHQLMMVRTRDDLQRFDQSDFNGVAETLRRHLDDLPESARIYAQARINNSIGTAAALESLPDDAWARYLLGDGNQPGEGDRLVQTADPKLALDVWRRRPVRVDGELPLFVLQALAETGEWGDPAYEGALQNLGRLGRDEQSQARLYALTKLELLRGQRLSDLHLDLLRQVDGGGKPEYVSLTSVAEATMHCKIVPASVLESGQFASETRLFLVHSTQFASVSSFRPHLDTLVVMQKDWADQVKDVYLSPLERLVERVRQFFQSLLSASPAGSGDDIRWSSNDSIRRFALLADAQARLTALDGGPLDRVSQQWRELRRRVTVDLAGRTAEAKVLMLRGMMQEFYRPIRQALCEALTTEPQVAGFMERLRPAFSICPIDLEPSEFVPRALRDPTNWFLSLVQCADRARIVETLLDAALKEVPDHPKLLRVRESWVTWDRALGKGHSSDWILSRQR